MSILWAIRISLIGCLFILIAIFAHFLKNRERYQRTLENTAMNTISVILFNIFCYAPMLIPSDESVVIKPSFLEHPLSVRWFDIMGFILMISGVALLIWTIVMRRAIGAQDTAGKLLTKGVYSFCRHPIYLGIILISLGLGLRGINVDGLIVFPLILLANVLQAKLEETYDVGSRFKEEYAIYKRHTRLFGPIWLWGILAFGFIIPSVITLLI